MNEPAVDLNEVIRKHRWDLKANYESEADAAARRAQCGFGTGKGKMAVQVLAHPDPCWCFVEASICLFLEPVTIKNGWRP